MTVLNLDQAPIALNPELKVAVESFAGFKNLWRMKRQGFLPFYRDLWQKHGDLVHFKLAHFDAIFVCHPKLVREIIVEKQRDFVKGRSYDGVRLFAGNGLLTSSGDEWIAQRRMVKGEFTPDAIRDLYQDMCSAINKSSTLFDRLAEDNKPVNIFDAMRMLAMNVVSTTLFGREFKKSEELNDAFEVLLQIAAIKSITPWGTSIYLPTISNWRFLKVRDQIFRITNAFTEEKLGTSAREPLIARLIEASKQHYKGSWKIHLRDQINTIFLAGHETTANTLGWAWALLGQHPEVRKRLLNELDQGFTGDFPEFSDLGRMPLLRNIAMEVLRLYPPVWVLMRDAEPQASLAGRQVPKKCRMVISPYFVHRHPQFWHEPERFMPDRFIGFADNPLLAHAYLPFSYGSRKCIGDHFASLEISLALAFLGKRYRFTPLSDLPEPEAVLTLRPKREVCMMVSKR